MLSEKSKQTNKKHFKSPRWPPVSRHELLVYALCAACCSRIPEATDGTGRGTKMVNFKEEQVPVLLAACGEEEDSLPVPLDASFRQLNLS